MIFNEDNCYLTGEDVQRHHVNLSVSVLASLGGAHLHDL